ncbi:MAG TPA: hypothetical protein VGE91_04760 [Solirubrobacterales bacterium]
MGFFDFLRKNDERAMPEPGTPEFEQAVAGSAIPDSRSVSMGDDGWTQPGGSQTLDLRGTGKGDAVKEVLREHGIDPEKKGQTIDASQVAGLREALIRALFRGVPNSGGIDRGIPKKGD